MSLQLSTPFAQVAYMELGLKRLLMLYYKSLYNQSAYKACNLWSNGIITWYMESFEERECVL